MQGVRIFLRTYGTARRISYTQALMKASTTVTLLSLAGIVTDLLMLNVHREKKKYKARKFEVSPDFGDLMIAIAEKNKKKEQLEREKRGNDDDTTTQDRERRWQQMLEEDM